MLRLFAGKVVFLVLIVTVSMYSCLQIESVKDKKTKIQSFTLESPSGRTKTDFRHNYGLPNSMESKTLNAMKAQYEANKDSLILGERYARYLAEMKQFNSATKVLEEITYADPKNVLYNRYLGQCYLLTGAVSKAIFYLNKAAIFVPDSLNPSDNLDMRLTKPKYNYHSLQFNIWYLLGNAYFIDKNYDKAITCFKNALSFSDVVNLRIMSSNFLFMAYSRAGNDALAKQVLADVGDVSSIRSARVHLKSLQIYQQKGNPNEIALGVQKRYFNDDDFTILLYCIGNYHLIHKDYAAGRVVLGRAIEEGKPYTLGHILAVSDMKLIEESLLAN